MAARNGKGGGRGVVRGQAGSRVGRGAGGGNGGGAGGRGRTGRGRVKSGRSRAPGQLDEPKPPQPRQHQEKPGLESRMRPRPKYQAREYRPAGKLEGMAALITGGDSGIGRAVAVLYAREGADVAINYLPEEQEDARETAAAVEQEGRRCVLIPGDLTDAAFCRELVDRAAGALGHLEILVSNAAWQNSKESILELDDAELERTFATNILAYIRLARAALKHLRPGSSIIATSSETSFLGPPALPDYSATKGAINTFTKSLAQELIKKGIRVNAVAPGPVWTPLNVADRGTKPKDVAEFGKKQPIGRAAQPEELAPAYVFLASEADSSYVTGEVLRVMGGEATGG